MAEYRAAPNVGSYIDSILASGASAITQGRAAAGGASTGAASSIFGLSEEEMSSFLGGGDIVQESAADLSIQDLLFNTSMDVTGRRGLTGSRFASAMPLWAQRAAQNGVFDRFPDADPYLGIVSQPGDERVYLGAAGGRPPVTFDEVDDQVDVNAKNLDERAVNREFNQQIDRQNKVERQLGEDPTKQKAGKKQQVDKTETTTQVKNRPYLWDQGEINSAMKQMRAAGINVTSFDDMVSVWGDMVDRAAMTYSLSEGKRKVTPWDVLDMYKSEAKAAGSYTNFQSGTRTTTSRSVNEVTEGEAFVALQGQLSQMLGRDPSDDEMKDFLHRANSMAARNPSITETISKYKNGEIVSQDSETSGGYTGADISQMAYEDAQSEEGYAEYQSATTYFNAALSALGALGDV